MATITSANPPGRCPVVSSADKSIVTKSQSSDDIIRNRLLFKLGIYNPNFTNASIHHKIRLVTTRTINIKDSTQSSRQHQMMQLKSREKMIPDQDVVMSSSWFERESSYLIPLKLERDYMIPSTSPPSSLLGLWSLKQQHPSFTSPNELHAGAHHHQRPVYVHFNSLVTVIPIPSRSYNHRRDQLRSCTKTKSSSRPTNAYVCHIKSTKSEHDLQQLVVDINIKEAVPQPRGGISIMLEEAGMIKL